MRNSNTSRIAWRLPWAAYGVLALGPFVAGLACSVYDNSLVGDVAAPLGGSGSSSGAAGTGDVGGTAVAGAATGGSASGSAGTSSGGNAGESSTVAGSGGTPSAGNGGSASAGTAGAGAGTGGEPTTGATESIDDMEDGDPEIEINAPRNGYWYVGGDLTAGATTDPPSSKFAMAKLASDRSTYAAHLKAVGYKDWGSVMGFNFTELSGAVKPYDGSAFCGVQFWGKAAAATTVRFRIPDIDTFHQQTGSVCQDPPTGAGTACYDHFGTSFGFTTAWKSFTAKFTDLTQAGTGYHPADMKLKADKLMAVEWALAGTGTTYEIWIDDVEFTKCK
jgi:hypothetical protein